MELGISRTFKFDAAHFLPEYDGPCGKMHGHTWTIKVSLTLDSYYFKEKLGGKFIMDFKDLKEGVNSILDGLDHSILNEVLPLKLYPSAENIAIYLCKSIHEEFSEDFPATTFGVRVEVQEGDGGTAFAFYRL